jgi:hypothetical protein
MMIFVGRIAMQAALHSWLTLPPEVSCRLKAADYAFGSIRPTGFL